MPEETEDEVMEEETEETETEPAVKDDVMAAVEACFAEGGEAYEMGKDEAIDAVIAKLEGMKGGESKPVLGGLGTDAEAMDLEEEA